MPQKLSQIVRPPASGTFVFIDEHEDSIDDGLWNSNPDLNAPPVWYNLPAARHNQAANIAYADGAVRPHKWLWPNRTWKRNLVAPGQRPTPTQGQSPQNPLDRQDFIWLLQLSPVL
jgi:prepilin-type processing-associated H-X9-DG protein